MAGSTPIYGFPYPQSTDLVADYPTLGQELATDVETTISGLKTGLNFIAQATISTSSSVSFNNVFSATYDNYLILVRSNANSADANLYMRLRASGADYTTANYQDQRLVTGSTVITADRVTGATQFRMGSVTLAGNFAAINVFSPYLTTNTGIQGQYGYYLATPEMFFNTGACTVTNQFDGFTLYPASGTMTAGSVKVYGYKNS